MIGLDGDKERAGGDDVRDDKTATHYSFRKMAVYSFASVPMLSQHNCKQKFAHAHLTLVPDSPQVGREMISNSDDSVLRQDMPAALAKVEEAARLLVEASAISRTDPTSKVARTKLIEGSRYP